MSKPKSRIVILLFLLVVFVLFTTSLAFAGTGRWLNDTKNYISFSNMPTTGKHNGTYSTATNKCSNCHAVHNAGTDYAGTNVYKLLRTADASAAQGACNFCHITGAAGVPQPYSTASFSGAPERARHRVDGTADTIPDSTVPTGASSQLGSDLVLGCLDCHNAAPHGSGNVWKLTKDEGAGGFTLETPVCKRCHDKNYTPNDKDQAFDKQTHPMVDNDNRRVGRATQVAATWANTYRCKFCHANAQGIGIFPHVSRAARFLMSTAGDLNQAGTGGYLDAVCTDCHRWSSDGVGITF